MSYPGHLLEESYDSVEMQSVYSAAPLVQQPVQKKENSEFEPAVPLLEIDLVSNPAGSAGVGWIHTT